MEQVVWLGVIGNSDVLQEKIWIWGRRNRGRDCYLCSGAAGICLSISHRIIQWYVLNHHGFVNVSSSLKLNDSVCISRGGLGVFQGAPSLCRLNFQLNQGGSLFFSPPRYGGMLRHQLTTTAPEQEQGLFFLWDSKDDRNWDKCCERHVKPYYVTQRLTLKHCSKCSLCRCVTVCEQL